MTVEHGMGQRIVRVAGARRVRLTPAPGTSAEPAPADPAIGTWTGAIGHPLPRR